MEKELLFLVDAARAAASIIRTDKFRETAVGLKAYGYGAIEHSYYYKMKDGFDSVKLRAPFADEEMSGYTGCVYFTHGDSELILKLDGKVEVDKDAKTIVSPDMIVEDLIDNLIYSKSGQFCLHQMIQLVDRVDFWKAYEDYKYKPFNISQIIMGEYSYINRIVPSDKYVKDMPEGWLDVDEDTQPNIIDSLRFFLDKRSEKILEDYSNSNINRKVMLRKPTLDEKISGGEGVRCIVTKYRTYLDHQFIYLKPVDTDWYRGKHYAYHVFAEVLSHCDEENKTDIIKAYEDVRKWYNREYDRDVENLNHHI